MTNAPRRHSDGEWRCLGILFSKVDKSFEFSPKLSPSWLNIEAHSAWEEPFGAITGWSHHLLQLPLQLQGAPNLWLSWMELVIGPLHMAENNIYIYTKNKWVTFGNLFTPTNAESFHPSTCLVSPPTFWPPRYRHRSSRSGVWDPSEVVGYLVGFGRIFSNSEKDVLYMDVSENSGTQQPWVFLLKMIILGCFGTIIIFGNIHMEIVIFSDFTGNTPTFDGQLKSSG